jgi:hypothetical protein
MMKKIKYLVFILMIFFQTSCTDWLELEPPNGLIRNEFWKTKEDVQAVLMAAYSKLASMNRMLFIYGEVRADMLKGEYGQPVKERMLMENNIYSDNTLTNWADFYKVIDYSNEVILNAEKVQAIDKTFTDYQKQGYVAEAYFIRSLAYFYLVRIYKEVPLVLEPTESDDVDVFIPKSTEDEVLDQIVSDLEANRAFAPSFSFPTKEENKGRASKAAYDALLADIALWRFKYEDVIKYADRLEQNKQIVLLPTNKWFELFYPGNSLEGIFEIQFDSKLQQSNSLASLTNRYSYQYSPSQKSIEMFGFKFSNELVRGEGASIAKYGESNYEIWKYIGQSPDGQTRRSGDEYGSCNWIVYRYADVILMKAEALSQMGNYTEAYELINKIRERANMPALKIADNQIAYEDAIMEERALEFAYEGKRWFDILRMGRRNNYARKDKLIEIIVSNVPSTQKRILATKLTNPLGWYLPIYEKEIERNTKLVQNPYYKTVK